MFDALVTPVIERPTRRRPPKRTQQHWYGLPDAQSWPAEAPGQENRMQCHSKDINTSGRTMNAAQKLPRFCTVTTLVPSWNLALKRTLALVKSPSLSEICGDAFR
jgi:hypothetical protein